jgi:biopolymer transport protein ExbD
MQAGGNDDAGLNEINVTPLVDVSLVLVIIFMVTAPMVVQSGIIVTSSKVTASVGKASKSDAIQLKLTKKAILVDNAKVDMDKFPDYMRAKLAKNEKKLVMISSDRDVLHGTLVTMLDESKKAGAKTITLMKEEK